MPYYIIKIRDEKYNQDYYLEWSTMIDAPVTVCSSLEEFKKYFKDEYGTSGIDGLEERLKRVEEKGISALPPFDNLERLFEYNHAGPNGCCLGREAILDFYCRNKFQ
jgi:hypothetical protein